MNHDVIDNRSLELHRRVAEKLRRKPSLLSIPVNNLKRWISQDPGNSTDALIEWQKILSQPLAKILRILTLNNEEGRRLRQSTPFTGILSKKERDEIFQKYEAFRS